MPASIVNPAWTGTTYWDNPAGERATRRLRVASETARSFAFSLATGKKIQPLPAKRMVVFFRHQGAVKWTRLP